MKYIIACLVLSFCMSCSTLQKPKEKFMTMELLRNIFPLFPVDINGQEFKGFFDSGGAAIALHTKYSHVGKRVDGIAARYGSSVSELKFAYYNSMTEIKLGNITAENYHVMIRPTSENYDVSIGSGFMYKNKGKVVIDYKSKKILFTNNLPDKYKKNLISFKRISRHILIDIDINGKLYTNFLLDTGAGLSSISDAVLKQVKYQKILGKEVIAVGVTGHKRKAFSVNIDNINCSKSKFNKAEFFVSPGSFKKRSKTFGETINGIIGANIFRNKVLVIDYEAKQYALFP